MRTHARLCSLLILTCAPSAFASTSITSETTVGTSGGTIIQSVTAEGDPAGKLSKRSSEGLIWNLQYTYNQSTTSDSATGASILNQSSEFRGGLGQRDHELEYCFTGIYGATPSESLNQFGLEVYLSNDFVFGGKPKKASHSKGDDDDSSDDDGSPQILTPKITLGVLKYSDAIGTGRTLRRRSLGAGLPATLRALNLNQYEAELKLTYSPFDWLSTKVSGTFYLYSQDVSQFVQLLDNFGAVNAGASSFASSVSGFPRYEASAGATFYFLESWDLSLTVNNAQSIYDGSFTQGYKGLLEKELGQNWMLSLGAEEDYSTSGPSTLALCDLEYRF